MLGAETSEVQAALGEPGPTSSSSSSSQQGLAASGESPRAGIAECSPHGGLVLEEGEGGGGGGGVQLPGLQEENHDAISAFLSHMLAANTLTANNGSSNPTQSQLEHRQRQEDSLLHAVVQALAFEAHREVLLSSLKMAASLKVEVWRGPASRLHNCAMSGTGIANGITAGAGDLSPLRARRRRSSTTSSAASVSASASIHAGARAGEAEAVAEAAGATE